MFFAHNMWAYQLPCGLSDPSVITKDIQRKEFGTLKILLVIMTIHLLSTHVLGFYDLVQ